MELWDLLGFFFSPTQEKSHIYIGPINFRDSSVWNNKYLLRETHLILLSITVLKPYFFQYVEGIKMF